MQVYTILYFVVTVVCIHLYTLVCYRKVIEHGLQMFEVEVYLLELKLCTHSNSSEVMTKEFSKTCTVGEL